MTPTTPNNEALAALVDAVERDLGSDFNSTHPSVYSALKRAKQSLASSGQAASAVPEGWKLVPGTATHNMLNAANAGRKKGRSSSGDIYRAMLDAAPTQPASAPAREVSDALHDAICTAVGIGNRSLDMARSEDGRAILDVLRRALVDFADVAATPAAPAQPRGAQEALDRIDDFIARCNGDDRGSCADVNTVRAHLASLEAEPKAQSQAAESEAAGLLEVARKVVEHVRGGRHLEREIAEMAEKAITAFLAGQAEPKVRAIYSRDNPPPLRRDGESIEDYRIRCGWDAPKAQAQAGGVREALLLAREYVVSASQRLYDGTNGAGIRAEATRRLALIDAALASPEARETAEPAAATIIKDLMASGESRPSCQAGLLDRCLCWKCTLGRARDHLDAAPPAVEKPAEPVAGKLLGALPRGTKLYAVGPVPIELAAVAETLAEGGGFWRSCSGCHELNEGHDTGPYSKVFKCSLGNGCSECGGLGAVWDDTDYDAMADALATPPAVEKPAEAVLHHTEAGVPYSIPMDWLRATFERANHDTRGFKKSRFGNYQNPAISRDWKWFRIGVGAAQNYAAPVSQAEPLMAQNQPSVSDNELPGMWARADFTGGETDGSTPPAPRAPSIEAVGEREPGEGPPFYISGPYPDGAFAVCDLFTGRVLRLFRGEQDLLRAAGTKTVRVGFEKFDMTDVAPTPASAGVEEFPLRDDQRLYFDQAQELLEEYADILDKGGNNSTANGARASAYVLRQMISASLGLQARTEGKV